jgi:hypothetical protein
MKHIRILASFAALSLFLVAGSARADYCLSFPAFPSTFFVGQGFTLPAKGKCKAFTGFALVGGGNNPIVGTGCVSADGSHLAFTLTYTETESGGLIFNDSASLILPAQTGTDFENASAAPFSVTGAKCKGQTVPAVGEGNATPVPAPGGPGTR